ncbi:DnaB-like helicase C-terminal domain-containing protein [Halobacillus litoralis]|uniref:DnaB-like helicase C-terminal domain-containing protein n=1 Tax=Halobacillus litoralis TaxID=45668 RepID=UPI001CD315B4|nr:DnaB-like helicase C-terminal domain-containing protein [Halobacillus litoralis]MCA1021501.1 replication protein [Halobacillus litoralis]
MWNSPQLYRTFKNHNIVKETFTNDQWWYWFKLGEVMYANGVRSFDEETVVAFLDTRKETRKSWSDKYQKYGGYDTVGLLRDLCKREKSNEEYHLSEIQKYEALRSFYNNGLINSRNKGLVKKLTDMNLKQIQTYFNHQFKDAFRNVNHGQVEVADLIDDDIYEDIEEMDKGTAMGVPFVDCPRLNKVMKGWQKGNLSYVILPSGVGKSTMVRTIFIMTLIRQNEKGIVFVNEEGKRQWRISVLAVVANTVLKKKLNRDKIFEGHYDDYTKSTLKEAADWLLANRPDMLKLIVLKKYRFEDVVNYTEYYKALGANYLILDTFKQDGSKTDMARWEAISNNSQELYDLVKEENLNMGCIATLQLKIGKVNRFLDHDCVGKSKEVVEVAGVTMLGRLLFKDEYHGKKNDLKPFNFVKKSGKWVKEKYVLDVNKDYIIFYFGKSRYGSTQHQIIYQVDYAYNTLTEVAYAHDRPEAPKGT